MSGEDGESFIMMHPMCLDLGPFCTVSCPKGSKLLGNVCEMTDFVEPILIDTLKTVYASPIPACPDNLVLFSDESEIGGWVCRRFKEKKPRKIKVVDTEPCQKEFFCTSSYSLIDGLCRKDVFSEPVVNIKYMQDPCDPLAIRCPPQFTYNATENICEYFSRSHAGPIPLVDTEKCAEKSPLGWHCPMDMSFDEGTGLCLSEIVEFSDALPPVGSERPFVDVFSSLRGNASWLPKQASMPHLKKKCPIGYEPIDTFPKGYFDDILFGSDSPPSNHHRSIVFLNNTHTNNNSSDFSLPSLSSTTNLNLVIPDSLDGMRFIEIPPYLSQSDPSLNSDVQWLVEEETAAVQEKEEKASVRLIPAAELQRPNYLPEPDPLAGGFTLGTSEIPACVRITKSQALPDPICPPKCMPNDGGDATYPFAVCVPIPPPLLQDLEDSEANNSSKNSGARFVESEDPNPPRVDLECLNGSPINPANPTCPLRLTAIPTPLCPEDCAPIVRSTAVLTRMPDTDRIFLPPAYPHGFDSETSDMSRPSSVFEFASNYSQSFYRPTGQPFIPDASQPGGSLPEINSLSTAFSSQQRTQVEVQAMITDFMNQRVSRRPMCHRVSPYTAEKCPLGSALEYVPLNETDVALGYLYPAAQHVWVDIRRSQSDTINRSDHKKKKLRPAIIKPAARLRERIRRCIRSWTKNPLWNCPADCGGVDGIYTNAARTRVVPCTRLFVKEEMICDEGNFILKTNPNTNEPICVRESVVVSPSWLCLNGGKLVLGPTGRLYPNFVCEYANQPGKEPKCPDELPNSPIPKGSFVLESTRLWSTDEVNQWEEYFRLGSRQGWVDRDAMLAYRCTRKLRFLPRIMSPVTGDLSQFYNNSNIINSSLSDIKNISSLGSTAISTVLPAQSNNNNSTDNIFGLRSAILNDVNQFEEQLWKLEGHEMSSARPNNISLLWPNFNSRV